MNNKHIKEFIDELKKVSFSYGAYDIFRDTCRLFAISLLKASLNSKTEADKYEQEYMGYLRKYGKEGLDHISECLCIVVNALEERREDFLGQVLEELNANNKGFGQFLTPIPVSRLMAEITTASPIPGKIVKMSDPSCGTGSLLIEGAEAFIRKGGRQMDLVIYADDLDFNACNIAYTQLSLLGYAARVTRMNSLSMEVFEGPWYTIGYFVYGMPMRLCKNEGAQEVPSTDNYPDPQQPQPQPQPKPLAQGELF